jgi:predicted  nucleic acid-binding Zn-ribbon protein
MSDFEPVIQSIEDKVSLLLKRLEDLNSENHRLKQELSSLSRNIEKQQQLLVTKEEEYNALKIAASMLGSNDNKRASKLKINALIRDINDCIASLSE